MPAAEGIVTTDLYPRSAGGGGRRQSIVGIAKGAGMIEPNMATMLVYLLTDLAVPRAELRVMLPRAVDAELQRHQRRQRHEHVGHRRAALVGPGALPRPGEFERALARSAATWPRTWSATARACATSSGVGPGPRDRARPRAGQGHRQRPALQVRRRRQRPQRGPAGPGHRQARGRAGAGHRPVAAAAADGRDRDLRGRGLQARPGEGGGARRPPARRGALRERPAPGGRLLPSDRLPAPRALRRDRGRPRRPRRRARSSSAPTSRTST
jgi:hypothetical protein